MNYIEQEQSPRRRYAIIAAVIVFHAALIYILFFWPSHPPAPHEGLIRVDIVADAKATKARQPLPAPGGQPR